MFLNQYFKKKIGTNKLLAPINQKTRTMKEF